MSAPSPNRTTGEPVGASRSSRWSALSSRLAYLIIGLLATSAVVTITYVTATERDNERRRNDESMQNVHQSVSLTLAEADTKIREFRETALAERKQKLKDLTDAQLAALTSLDASVRSGAISLDAAQETASRALYEYRYGSDDYFFVFTPEMVSVVEPNPMFRGDMIDYRDPAGKAFFQEFRSVALGPGSGFVEYVGSRRGADEPAPKISYIAYFEPWEWVVGTGVYLDDIDAVAAAQLAATKEQLSGSLERVRFAEAGLFFVVDRNGDIVAGPRSGGVDGIEQETDLVARLIGAAPPDGTIATLTDRARFGGDTQTWRFKVSSVGVNQWVLVAAVPADVLVESANELAVRQALLIALVLVVGLGVGITASRRIVRPVRDLTDAAIALEGEQFEPASLDGAAGRRDELGVLARAFRRMAAEVVERERTLRERVRRLEVVVDQRKVDQEINAIVETDFFRRLEAQAEVLRRSDTPES